MHRLDGVDFAPACVRAADKQDTAAICRGEKRMAVNNVGFGTSVPIGPPPGGPISPSHDIGEPSSPRVPGDLTPLSLTSDAPQGPGSTPKRMAVLPKETDEVAEALAKHIDQFVMQNFQKVQEKTKEAMKGVFEKDEDDEDEYEEE
jgi:hypothetical protein